MNDKIKVKITFEENGRTYSCGLLTILKEMGINATEGDVRVAVFELMAKNETNYENTDADA